MIVIVKPSFQPTRAAVAIVAFVLLAGCGQRGPLYLPGQTQPPKSTPKAPPASSSPTAPVEPGKTLPPTNPAEPATVK